MLGIYCIQSKEKLCEKDALDFHDITHNINNSKNVSSHHHYDNNIMSSFYHLNHLNHGNFEYRDNDIYINVYGFILGHNTKESLLNIKELYNIQGKNFPKFIDGEFTILLHNYKTNETSIISDRFNTRVHFYTIDNNRIFISPYPNNLINVKENKIILKSSINEYLTNYCIDSCNLGGKTFYKDIYSIPPGTILTFKNGRVSSKHKYYSFHYEEDDSIKENKFAKQSAKLFKNAVLKRLDENNKYILELSGGLDSRMILATICDVFNRKKVKSITFGEPSCDEAKIARDVAVTLRVKHKILPITPEMILDNRKTHVDLTGGMSYIGVSYQEPISKYMSTKNNVVIDGFALDLMLGGHYLIRDTPSDEITMNERVMFNQVGEIPLRVHLETIHPTTDIDFINYICKIPQEYRENHRIYRSFIQYINRDMYNIPYNKTMIPPSRPLKEWNQNSRKIEILEFSKNILRYYTRGLINIPDNRSYVNFHEWLYTNKRWKNYLESNIYDICSEIYDIPIVEKILNKNMLKPSDITKRLYLSTVAELVHGNDYYTFE